MKGRNEEFGRVFCFMVDHGSNSSVTYVCLDRDGMEVDTEMVDNTANVDVEKEMAGNNPHLF